MSSEQNLLNIPPILPTKKMKRLQKHAGWHAPVFALEDFIANGTMTLAPTEGKIALHARVDPIRVLNFASETVMWMKVLSVLSLQISSISKSDDYCRSDNTLC
jgi:hypothetical protein